MNAQAAQSLPAANTDAPSAPGTSARGWYAYIAAAASAVALLGVLNIGGTMYQLFKGMPIRIALLATGFNVLFQLVPAIAVWRRHRHSRVLCIGGAAVTLLSFGMVAAQWVGSVQVVALVGCILSATLLILALLPRSTRTFRAVVAAANDTHSAVGR